MAWVGTGLVWGMSGGVARSRSLGKRRRPGRACRSCRSATAISVSAGAPNKDVAGTLRQTIARINALPEPPAFILHTGDITHSARPEEFDAVAELLKETKTGRVFYVPGEHDFDADGNREYLRRYGRGTQGNGWYSFDTQGIHFIGLVNVATAKSGSKDGGLGVIGPDQLQWLERDVAGLADSTPVVVFSAVPLWSVYEKWGWGTRIPQVLRILRRFGSLTVLNGHIHQVMQKVEGQCDVSHGPLDRLPAVATGKRNAGTDRDLPAERLRSMLGLTAVSYVENAGSLAIVDTTL